MSRQTRATTVVSQPPRLSIAAGVRAAQPQPRLLDRVLGFGARARASGTPPRAGAPVLLEPRRQPVVLTHPDHILLCHSLRPGAVIRLTLHLSHM